MPNLNGHTESIKNSQFKAAWQSGPTRTIRVPIALADITLEYARQLDRAVEPRDTATETDNQASDLDKSLIVEPRDTAGSIGSEVDLNVTSTPDTSDSSDERFAHALVTPEEVSKHSAIFGFTPDEALADAHFQINMLQANYDELEDRYEVAKREIAKLRSQLETVQENSEIDFDFAGKAGELKNWLGKILGKALPKQITVKAIQKILEGGDN